MKIIDPKDMAGLPGQSLETNDFFLFRCHSGLSCFNRCCRNLTLLLYPYDVLRLKNRLGISSEQFIETYVDVVLRKDEFFPEVVLRMSLDGERTCPFLSIEGCSVYSDRPDTCRMFPIEQGVRFKGPSGDSSPVYFMRPPKFCLGPFENKVCTISTWVTEQETKKYQQMTRQWAAIRRLLIGDPWGGEGPAGRRAKMTFMAVYNIDRFRDFVFNSSFLKRYRVKASLKKKLRQSDEVLLQFGFDWVKLVLWQIPTKNIRPK